MSWRLFNSEVSPHQGLFRDLPTAARSPYAEAWKEFDKLQKRARDRGAAWWVHLVTGNLLPLLGGGAFSLTAWKGHKAYVVAAFIGLLIWAVFKGMSDRQRFAEWPCPRCHSIWPGTKTEKDSACKVCGLRIHQLTP